MTSPQIAGGFVGNTIMGYAVETQVDSALLDLVLKVVDGVVKLLYLDKAENLGVLSIQLPPPLNKLLELQLLGDGNLLYVNLLGLKIGASLSRADPDHPEQTDTAIITIGDSVIKLPCSKDGIDATGEHEEIKIALVKGNRTKIDNCSVSGVSLGYDVFGGGADDQQNGSDAKGFAGGFVGVNHEGVVRNSRMIRCDVVRGTPEEVGPFTGRTELDSVYDFNTVKGIEGEGNSYQVYRPEDAELTTAKTQNGREIASVQRDTSFQTVFNRYDVSHLDVIEKYKDFKDAMMTSATGERTVPLDVYESSAKAVLMRDVNLPDNHEGVTPEPGESPDPCAQTLDLTLTKVWKDWYRPSLRPESITVEIWRSYTDAQGVLHEEPYQTVTLTTADAQKETSTWKKVIADLPVAKQETVDGQEVIYYYTYYAKENPVEGYHSDVSVDQTGQIIITNTAARPALPGTGGWGDWVFILIGGAFVLWGLCGRKHRVKGKRCA